jgi:hypothetical protein
VAFVVRASVARVTRRCAALGLLVALSFLPVRAIADSHRDDGLYGRFAGDLWLGAALGGGVLAAPGGARDAGVLELRARYLDSVGPFLFAQGSGLFGQESGWQLGGGVEIRPLFLARFLTARSLGNAWLDVLIDSLGLELGMAATGLEAHTRAALMVGGGLEIPLFLGAPRVSLRLGARLVHADADGQGVAPAVRNELSVLAALVVAAPVDAGLAGREGPRARRE